ncbi:MAG: ExbD/TolR family protein [Pirellulales bacterium]
MKVEVPSVAMGDIAFNLIIFFVILSRAQDDSHLQWIPASTPKVESAKPSKASIVIDKDNKLYLNGAEIGASQLTQGLEDLLGAAPPGDRVVLLKVHKEILAQRFENVIESISEAGGELVHILDETPPGG